MSISRKTMYFFHNYRTYIRFQLKTWTRNLKTCFQVTQNKAIQFYEPIPTRTRQKWNYIKPFSARLEIKIVACFLFLIKKEVPIIMEACEVLVRHCSTLRLYQHGHIALFRSVARACGNLGSKLKLGISKPLN